MMGDFVSEFNLWIKDEASLEDGWKFVLLDSFSESVSVHKTREDAERYATDCESKHGPVIVLEVLSLRRRLR